jgi:hypothetical protein
VSTSAVGLAELHLDLLYERDAEGWIARCRNYDGPAPLVHFVRTAEDNRWLLAASIRSHERVEVQAALEALPIGFDDPEQRPPDTRALQDVLGREARVERGPAFAFPDVLSEPSRRAELLLDPHLTRTVPELAWVRAAKPHEQPLATARNDRGEVVAVCHSSRATAAGAEAGVETASDYRGGGLAGEVTLAWAAAVRAEGRTPLYSTDWSNLASRAVARKLGLVMYGEDCRLT